MEFIAPAREATAEIEVKKSRFIGTVAPAFSAEEAEARIAAVRRRYSDATHNVFAYLVGSGTPLERLSDDGEPRGTAGYPVLEVIKKRGLRNVVCVVTRYFGGTLLGAGGLLRAYGRAASAALDAAGTARYVYHKVLSAVLDYDQLGKVQRDLEARGVQVFGVSYAEKVTLRAYVPSEEVDSAVGWLKNLTAGKGLFIVEEGKFIPR